MDVPPKTRTSALPRPKKLCSGPRPKNASKSEPSVAPGTRARATVPHTETASPSKLACRPTARGKTPAKTTSKNNTQNGSAAETASHVTRSTPKTKTPAKTTSRNNTQNGAAAETASHVTRSTLNGKTTSRNNSQNGVATNADPHPITMTAKGKTPGKPRNHTHTAEPVTTRSSSRTRRDHSASDSTRSSSRNRKEHAFVEPPPTVGYRELIKLYADLQQKHDSVEKQLQKSQSERRKIAEKIDQNKDMVRDLEERNVQLTQELEDQASKFEASMLEQEENSQEVIGRLQTQLDRCQEELERNNIDAVSLEPLHLGETRAEWPDELTAAKEKAGKLQDSLMMIRDVHTKYIQRVAFMVER